VRYLHRHPSEIDLTIDQMAEVAFIGREADRQRNEQLGAMFGGGS